MAMEIVKSGGKDMDENLGIDIDALLYGSGPVPTPGIENDLAAMLDRQIARAIAQDKKMTTLLLVGDLSGPKCLPTHCEDMCPSFTLISMRMVGATKIAMFFVPVEGEMAELFEEIDGRRGLQAVAYDPQGRTKEAYLL